MLATQIAFLQDMYLHLFSVEQSTVCDAELHVKWSPVVSLVLTTKLVSRKFLPLQQFSDFLSTQRSKL